MKAALFFLPAALLAADDGTEFFEKNIRPVLVEKCYACHSAKIKTPMGGLRVDSRDGIRKGGDTGPAVVARDPARSLLLTAISYADLRLKMPPNGKLPDAEIAAFRAWIEIGAPDPRIEPSAAPAANTIDLDEGRKFWAFQPIRKSEPPPVRGTAWPANPIDRFLLAKLEQNRIAPAPPADRRDWLRRVTFDLTGLPPTALELDAYLADSSPRAHENVVGRLLASPHYGERWARHWLDLVRYAETNGHEFDNDKLDAWRYRDYLIRAFNADVPYDQLVREHIAGDLLTAPRTTPDGAYLESPLGTTAFWFGEVLNSATDSVKSRADQVDNQIDVLSKTFLGLTVACARCHDHKFDPLPTVDYYSLAGYLHSTAMREAVIDSPARAAAIGAAHTRIEEANLEIHKILTAASAWPPPAPMRLREGETLFTDFDNYDGWFISGEAFRRGPRRDTAPNQPLKGYAGETMASSFGAGTDRLTGSLTSRKFVMPKLYMHVRMAGTKTARAGDRTPLRVTVVADDHKSEFFFPEGPAWTWKTIRMTKEIGRMCYVEIVDRDPNGHLAVDKIVLSDSEQRPEEPAVIDGPTTLEETAEPLPENYRRIIASHAAARASAEAKIPESAWGMIAADQNPHDVKVHIRGSHKNLGKIAPRRPLQVIGGTHSEPGGASRLELAAWLASSENPLTARVMVNRIWRHHFGQGLVATPDNFGKMGERPSHPELLDWLAASFIESGWSIKSMHRAMVLSAAYRMSSRPLEAAAKIDPRNSLLHHIPVRRLEAEAVRDAILAVSGRLDRTLHGPSVPPHVSKYQDGRGKPVSGPLDGNGRRSIYIQVRRNFLTPMFLAFDYPLPVSTIGARGASTVPSQALMMMNNEFVAQQARHWADRITAAEPDPERRIDRMFLEAFARPADAAEKRDLLDFVRQHRDPATAWVDVAHVLLNSAEFLYVR